MNSALSEITFLLKFCLNAECTFMSENTHFDNLETNLVVQSSTHFTNFVNNIWEEMTITSQKLIIELGHNLIK